jgi:hypothetical protein
MSDAQSAGGFGLEVIFAAVDVLAVRACAGEPAGSSILLVCVGPAAHEMA